MGGRNRVCGNKGCGHRGCGYSGCDKMGFGNTGFGYRRYCNRGWAIGVVVIGNSNIMCVWEYGVVARWVLAIRDGGNIGFGKNPVVTVWVFGNMLLW